MHGEAAVRSESDEGGAVDEGGAAALVDELEVTIAASARGGEVLLVEVPLRPSR